MRGSVALISILIISAFALILVISMSEVNISKSSQSYNSEAGKIQLYSAEACLEEAIIRLEDNPAFSDGSMTFDGDTSCTISVANNQIDISVSYLDFSQNFRANFEVSVNGEANNVTLLTWSEI